MASGKPVIVSSNRLKQAYAHAFSNDRWKLSSGSDNHDNLPDRECSRSASPERRHRSRGQHSDRHRRPAHDDYADLRREVREEQDRHHRADDTGEWERRNYNVLKERFDKERKKTTNLVKRLEEATARAEKAEVEAVKTKFAAEDEAKKAKEKIDRQAALVRQAEKEKKELEKFREKARTERCEETIAADLIRVSTELERATLGDIRNTLFADNLCGAVALHLCRQQILDFDSALELLHEETDEKIAAAVGGAVDEARKDLKRRPIDTRAEAVAPLKKLRPEEREKAKKKTEEAALAIPAPTPATDKNGKPYGAQPGQKTATVPALKGGLPITIHKAVSNPANYKNVGDISSVVALE